MDNSVILSKVDHTLLVQNAAWGGIKRLCEEALEYKTASVCIPPSYVSRVKAEYSGLTICTVIGFPNGYSVTPSKLAEIKQAISDGATEFDMVINIADAKNGDFEKIKNEIAALKSSAGKNILKVIIETCYLEQSEKIALCRAVTDAKADYIKTSTGFGTAGATLDDVKLFKENIGQGVKIKAAGGIRTKQHMIDFINAGCDRLGTSSAIKILSGEKPEGY